MQAAFGQYKSADKAETEKELAKVIAGIEAAGMDPTHSPKVKDLSARLQSEAVDVGALESEVYDHLFSFFRRYYSEGDYLAKRVYKPGVYAIPYEGEEVTLHWANKDQYYIKTSEYLRDYAFRLRPDDDKRPMRVHFRLADAAEGEHGNVKAMEGRDRVFILTAPGDSGHDFIAEEDGERGKDLIIRFEYRPVTLTDWPDDAREGKSKPPSQKDLIAIAAARVLAVSEASLAAWIDVLRKPHVTTGGETADYTRLEAHLKRYTARNTFDYFIHKDLGGFLRRELDFYIKNEVMHLDDVENETAPRVEQYLSKIKVIRRIAGKIIDFLAQLEDFQKKLWLKKKFVVETRYCIRLGCIPETFYEEIAENNAQREEWVNLFSIDEIVGDLMRPGYEAPVTAAFLRAQPTLVVDTRHFNARFITRLLESLPDVDEPTDGLVFHSDNSQALNLMHAKYRGRVGCVYIDPPYNTGDDGFPYKDSYQHSTWLAMLTDRFSSGRPLESPLAMVTISIDDTELDRLCEAVRSVYGPQEVAKLIWDRNRKNDARYFSVGHEYMVVVAHDRAALATSQVAFREPKDGIDEARELFGHLRAEHSDDWAAIRTAWLAWFETIPVADPRRRLLRYTKVGPRGPYRDDRDASWPGGGGPRYEVLHPVTKRPVKIPSRGWVYPTAERFWQAYDQGRIEFGPDESKIPSPVSYLFDSDGQVMPSVHYSYAQTAAQEFDAFFGRRVFDNPKNWRDIARILRYLGDPQALTLDYFAGSGTTGHAVINLNREDGGRRKFIMVEMGDYFDTVLLPRIKKVTFTPEWKDGKPKRLATAEEAKRSPGIVKVVRLESYEDALNNLEARRSDTQQLLLDAGDAQGADGLKEQYLLRYMLNVETRGSQSLLNVQAFIDPTAYKLKVKRPGSDESREVNVDLLETFNWLIGLTVKHIAAPQNFNATFERDSEKRLRFKGRLKQEADGPYWFRTVTGTIPDGRKTLIIWRKLTGEPEQDNLALDEWFTKQGYSAKDSEFDLIYVNGGNNLENLKTTDDRWKVRLIEEDFHRLMFESEGA
ncbi:MAG: DNA methyltransferase [Gemmatimonadota bacterium]